MVTDFILQLWFGLVDWFLGLLPTDPLPQGLTLGWLMDMNYFLPVSEMFGLLVLMFAMGGPFIAASLIIWLVVGVARGGQTKA